MSIQLNISRVAVWKHIKTLQTKGYEISSSRKGYLLLNRPDVLTDVELKDDQIIHFNELESSMDRARKLIFEGLSEQKVIIAETQNAGQSLSGQKWESTQGGFYATFIYFPTHHPSDYWRYSFAASNAVVKTIKSLYKLKAQIVWPSEIWISNKKIGGVLIEYLCNSQGFIYMNVGIGVNLNNIQSKKKRTSLHQELRTRINRKEFYLHLKSQLNKSLSELKNSTKEWLTSLSKKDSLEKILSNDKKNLHYEIEGINSHGALIINGDGGQFYKTIEDSLPIHLKTQRETR